MPLIFRAALAGALTLSVAAAAGPAAADEVSEPETESGGMSSPPAFGAGLFLTGVGVAGLVTGGYFYASGSGACDGIARDVVPTDAQIDECRSGINRQVGGVVALVTGGAFVLGGIPVMAVGASPATTEASADRPRVAFEVLPFGAALRGEF